MSGGTEGQQQLYQGALAGACAADNGDLLPGSDVDGDVADRRLVGVVVAEGDVLEVDVPPEYRLLLRGLVGAPLGICHLGDAPGGHLGVGEHDDGKGGHQNPVHHQGDVLDNGKDVPGAGRAHQLHPRAAHPDDDHGGGVENKQGQGGHGPHMDVGPDDVLRHHPGGIGQALLLVGLLVEGPDHPDAPQPLPHDVVLPVGVVVGLLPQGVNPPADEHHHHEQGRDKAQQQQAQHRVLPQSQQHAPQKQHRNGGHGAREHGGHPGYGFDVVGGAGDQGGGAHSAELLKGEGVDLLEDVPAQVGAEVRHHLGAGLGPQQHGPQAHQGHKEHRRTAADDIGKIGAVYACVDNAAHNGGQQQIAQGGHGHHGDGKDHLAPVGPEIGYNVFHSVILIYICRYSQKGQVGSSPPRGSPCARRCG